MRPFQNSIEALARLGMRATGALSYAFLEKGCDARPCPAAPAIVEYPLRTDITIVASVVFLFGSEAEALRARSRLTRVAAAMQAVWSAAATEPYTRLIARVAELETQLMDSKIVDRAQGLLTDATSSDPTDVIGRHVDNVLRPTATSRFLEQALAALEDEMDERRVVGQAKQILQSLDRMSEEQAHHHLRLLSRKSRKPLKDIAQQVIDGQYLLKGKTA